MKSFLLFIGTISVLLCSIHGRELFRFRREKSEDGEEGDALTSMIQSGIGSIFGQFDALPQAMQKSQIKLLSLTEGMLDRSTELLDSFSENIQEYRNSTGKAKINIKRGLKFLKQKARRMREDIEDEIEIEKEKLENESNLTDEEKKETTEKISQLSDARMKLKEAMKRRNWKSSSFLLSKLTGDKKDEVEEESDRPKRMARHFLARMIESAEDRVKSKVHDIHDARKQLRIHSKNKTHTNKNTKQQEDKIDEDKDEDDEEISAPKKDVIDRPVGVGLGDGFGQHT